MPGEKTIKPSAWKTEAANCTAAALVFLNTLKKPAFDRNEYDEGRRVMTYSRTALAMSATYYSRLVGKD